MSRDFNKVIIMGRLAKDPDIRFTPSNQKVARFTVCTGRQWKNKTTGEVQSHTDFIPVTAWSFTADLCERYVRKGSQILLEGRITTRDYDDVKTGQHKWVTEVVAENIVLLPSGGKGSAQTGASAPSAQPQAQYYPGADTGSLSEGKGFEDDFPLDFSELNTGSGEVEIPF